MGKRELLLIVGFVIAGVIVYTITAQPPAPNERSLSFSRIIEGIRREVHGNPARAETTKTETYSLPPETAELLLRGNFAQLEITGEDRADLETTLRVVSNGYDDEEAKRLAEETTVRVDRPGPAISFSPDAPERGRQSLYLTIKAPSRLRLRVESPSTGVTASNVAAVELLSARNDTTITQVAGRVTVTHRGGRLVIEDVASLKLSARNAETTLRRVHGDASISLQSGELTADAIGGPLDLESQNAEVRIEDAKEMRGPVRVNAVGGRVTITALEADSRIDGRSTDIEVDMAAAVPLVIYNDGSDAVELTLPPGGFLLDALARNGRISPEDTLRHLGLSVTTSDESKEQRVSGSVKGGGPAITLRSNGGDITLLTR